MSVSISDHVRPLGVASGRYLQVLLNGVSLRRTADGAVLEVQFKNDTPAIWSRHGRRAVFAQYASALSRESQIQQIQENIDRIVIGGDERARFTGADFPLRYASGGALPIVRFRNRDYYCLIYREIHPIGWNIANGGTDSIYELLDPTHTIEREFQEEVLILDPRRKIRSSYDRTDRAGPPSLFTPASLAFESLPWLGDINDYSPWDVTLKWGEGPDRLIVRFDHEFRSELSGFYINITAADCAIEVDRLVYLDLDEDAVIIDTETIEHKMLDSPIGLFDVNRLNREVRTEPRGKRKLIPDVIFHSGRLFEGSELNARIEHFLGWVQPFVDYEDMADLRTAQGDGRSLDLCPVTDGLIRRIMPGVTPPPGSTNSGRRFDTFLSHPTHPNIQVVFEFLTNKLKKKVFSYQTTSDTTAFMSEINNAIEQSSCMVVYGTEATHFQRKFVRFETQQFINDMVQERRPKLKLFCLAPGVKLGELPSDLAAMSWIINHVDMDECLDELGRALSRV